MSFGSRFRLIVITFRTLDVSGVRLKASVETSPDQRPQGKLGIWGPAVTTLGNISKMPVSISISDDVLY
jgi:vacuolar protein sorting-associated protein 13A/C